MLLFFVIQRVSEIYGIVVKKSLVLSFESLTNQEFLLFFVYECNLQVNGEWVIEFGSLSLVFMLSNCKDTLKQRG